MTNNTPNIKKVSSFVLRQGRLTNSQADALDQYGEEFFINSTQLSNRQQTDLILPQTPYVITKKPTSLNQYFSRVTQESLKILEIGFGNGLSLLSMCETYRHHDFLGFEVHLPGVARLVKEAKEKNITNLKIIRADVQSFLPLLIPDQSISEIYILFPDPWHKKRHHKRRLINTVFVTELHRILQNNGLLHIVTDWQNYADHIQSLINTDSRFRQSNSLNLSKRVQTSYEKRGLKLGHEIVEMLYIKN